MRKEEVLAICNKIQGLADAYHDIHYEYCSSEDKHWGTSCVFLKSLIEEYEMCLPERNESCVTSKDQLEEIYSVIHDRFCMNNEYAEISHEETHLNPICRYFESLLNVSRDEDISDCNKCGCVCHSGCRWCKHECGQI